MEYPILRCIWLCVMAQSGSISILVVLFHHPTGKPSPPFHQRFLRGDTWAKRIRGINLRSIRKFSSVSQHNPRSKLFPMAWASSQVSADTRISEGSPWGLPQAQNWRASRPIRFLLFLESDDCRLNLLPKNGGQPQRLDPLRSSLGLPEAQTPRFKSG